MESIAASPAGMSFAVIFLIISEGDRIAADALLIGAKRLLGSVPLYRLVEIVSR